MGERKVLNKYFPPDFDPKKVPRMKRDPEKQIGVRMMIPFSMQCNTCGEFMYRGKKFNSLKEDCIGEDYLGIKRFRFYIKCVICSQEITFKTDPENGDYELETGASRNFEAWTDKKATEEEHKKAREEEEKSDNMKALENRTLDSKIELEIMDALDEIKSVNRRHETVDTSQVLKAAAARRAQAGDAEVAAGKFAPEDEEMIASIQFGGPKVRRLSDEDSGTTTSAQKSAVKSQEKSKKTNGALGNGHEAESRDSTERNSEDVQSGDTTNLEGVEGGDKSSSSLSGTSLLVAGIEARAKKEAEKTREAASNSAKPQLVLKRRKVEGDGEKHKKNRKRHKGKAKGVDDGMAGPGKGEDVSKSGSTGIASTSGGLASLLGSYESSGSDEGR